MLTESLMLRRSLGSAFSEHYVEWAVECLCSGSDSPNLRILAGLNPKLEADEIESYFLKTCSELGLEPTSTAEGPRRSLWLICRAYEHGEFSAESALQMLARLYEHSDFADPLLRVFYDIEEELSLRGSGYEGNFYPPVALESLDDALRVEFDLFAEAAQLELPEGFLGFIRCEKCGHIGEPKFREKRLWDRLKALLPGRRPYVPTWPTCPKCGSFDYKSMMCPEVRREYYLQIRQHNERGQNRADE